MTINKILKPNILFIVLDACRADKFYNNKNSETPTIDSLVKQGSYFSQDISSTDYTMSAISSIFTSRYPFGVGETKQYYYKIHSDSTSYISHLKNNGYRCYATMHTALSAMGFSSYFENNDQSYPLGLQLYSGLGDKILQMLKPGIMESPWIYFVHVLDLHRPIRVPDFEKMSINDRYDQMMEIIDSWLAKILDAIDLKNTLLVITSDHGDYIPVIDNTAKTSQSIIEKSKSFIKFFIPKSQITNIHKKKKKLLRQVRSSKLKTSYEKRSLNERPDEARFQFDELIRVPLLFAGYGVPSRGVIPNLVRNIDILPTIESILDLPNKKSDVHGRSLFPLFENKKMEEIPVYMESTTIHTGQQAPKPVIGIRTSSYKYFRSLKNPNENCHLYNLKADPTEENNLIEKNPEKVNEMEKLLEKIRNETIFRTSPEKYDDDESIRVEEELKKLGYI
jgi:arylsulfatase A-like enzyme